MTRSNAQGKYSDQCGDQSQRGVDYFEPITTYL